MSKKAEDEHEEGEIVDDDLEDISDNPIIEPSFTGKCVSPIGHLRAISLSSLSDEEEATRVRKVAPQRIRKRHRSKRDSKHIKRRRNHRRRYSDDDSSDVEICGVVNNPFKAAVLRVDKDDCPKNNSLESRLKVMTRKEGNQLNNSKGSSHETKSGTDADVPPTTSITADNKESDEDFDKELVELRLEALKTAFINKLGSRKKRKSRDTADHGDVVSDETEINKENTLIVNNNIEDNKKTIEKTESVDDTLPEEDLDVLRAELLASISKKIVGEKPEAGPTNITLKINDNVRKTFVNKVPAKTKASFKINRVVKNTSVTIVNKPTLKLPEVKPLIINVNGESDSDEEIERPVVKDENTLIIENTVERFLKQQRAKVEAEKKKLLSPISSSTVAQLVKTEVKPLAKSLPKLNISATNYKTPVRSKKSPTIEKSAVKLLPKSKQLEYQRLLLKLKNAERKTRVRRTSFKGNVEVSKNSPLLKNNTVKNKIIKSKLVATPNRTPTSIDRKTEALKLHKTLKEMQIEKNGRLQIQDKYRVLTPLMRKINEASKDRKKCDQEVKRLLEELTEAKKRQTKSQANFTSAIRLLYSQKEKIDISRSKLLAQKKIASDSVKAAKPSNSCVGANSIVRSSELPAGSGETQKEIAEVPTESSNIEVNFGDPNDIDLIIGKQNAKIPKYVSPLDAGRIENEDPFSIMCPFEVDGLCRDPECTYKHYLR